MLSHKGLTCADDGSPLRKTRASKLLRTDKKFRRRFAVGYFYVGLSSPLALGLFVGLVLCRNEDKRSMTARFHNVAEGNISRLRDAQAHACATRKHFTRRSNDRRISCLRDSADISPPGAHKHREDLRFRRVCGVFVIVIAPVKHLKKRQNSIQRIFLKIVLQPLDKSKFMRTLVKYVREHGLYIKLW